MLLPSQQGHQVQTPAAKQLLLSALLQQQQYASRQTLTVFRALRSLLGTTLSQQPRRLLTATVNSNQIALQSQ